MSEHPATVLLGWRELIKDYSTLLELTFVLGQNNPNAQRFLYEGPCGSTLVWDGLEDGVGFQKVFDSFIEDSEGGMEELQEICDRLERLQFGSNAWEQKLTQEIQTRSLKAAQAERQLANERTRNDRLSEENADLRDQLGAFFRTRTLSRSILALVRANPRPIA
jgi:hypothetical protein